jgi:hypothetical protein
MVLFDYLNVYNDNDNNNNNNNNNNIILLLLFKVYQWLTAGLWF